MINLASLTALIRTLRQVGGPDGPALPPSRVPPVASLTPEDRSASGAGTSAVQGWARSQARNAALIDEELLRSPGQPRNAEVAARGGSGTGARIAGHAAHVTGEMASASPRTDRASQPHPVESAPLELTGGGKVLQSVLRASNAAAPMPPAVVSEAPLVASARAMPAELGRALHQALADSGLFYESHLARWVRRDYPLSALEREPQAGWTSAASLGGASQTPAAAALPDSTVQLLTRQLDALDTRAVVWSGELWPGQRATVALEEDRSVTDEDLDAGHDPAVSAWRTRIVLDMPSLGRVEATLAMRRNSLDLLLEAQHPEAHARLTEAHDALAAALSDSRVQLGNFAVAVHALR